MAKIDSLIDQFKDIDELKIYTQSQQKTIFDLNKKLKAIEEENNSLKALCDKKIIQELDENEKQLEYSSDEEAICKRQLQLLKQLAFNRELTLEETKKVEIYSKINGATTKKKVDPFTQTDTKELLKLVESNE